MLLRKNDGSITRAAAAGFTLIEMMIVISIIGLISVAEMRRRGADMDDLAAKSAGIQMRQMAEASNSYLVTNYASLVTLTDPACAVNGADSCALDPSALVSSNLLPAGATTRNAWDSDYSIQIRRVGIAPNQSLHGIILTKEPWTRDVNGAGGPRLSELGRAVKEIGPDGGVTQDGATISGYSGSWTATPAEAPTLAKAGQLAARIGYSSAAMTVFLRRDGTLPMTGDLNMGGRSIKVAKDGSFSGNLSAGSATVSGDVASGTSTVAGGLTAGSASVSGALTAGTASVAGNASIGGNATIAGGAAVAGNLTAAKVTAAGDVTAGGDLNGKGANVQETVNAKELYYTGAGQYGTDHLGRKVIVATYQGADHDMIAKPACAHGGTPSIDVTPTNVVSAGYWTWENGKPYAATQFVARAVDVGAAWELEVQTWAVDGTGSWVGVSAGTAAATVTCKYAF